MPMPYVELETLAMLLTPIYAGIGFIAWNQWKCPFGCGRRRVHPSTPEED